MIKIISYCKKTVIARRVFYAAAIHFFNAFLDCFAKNARNDAALLRIKNMCLTITTITLCIGLTGCFTSKYVEQKQYILAVEKPVSGPRITKKSSLHINHVAAAAPFDQLNFLYRVNKYQYLTDYYNGFLVPPAKQLEAILINYINNSSKFAIQNDALSASNTLQVQLNEFYADYRDKQNPSAIISMHFILTRSSDNKAILDKTLTQKIALPTKNTASLLSAWNIGLQNIATNVTRSLNQCIK